MAARELALRLITKHGRRDGVVRRPSADAVAPSDRPWRPDDAASGPDPVVATELPVVVLDAETYRKSMGPDTRLAPEATAVALVAAASGVELRVGDTLETRRVRYAVLQVDLLAPGETDVLYTLHMRG